MYVYALVTGSYRTARYHRVRLAIGDVWAADDPFVKSHPHLFSTTPPKIGRTVAAPVEQATAAPGEKRTVKRGS